MKIETSLLTNQVYDVLRSKIIAGDYTAGEKLDIQRLADGFGVSRSPVKDAINQLVYDGLIEIIPRKGTYVTELNVTAFIELLDARLMIENWAAGQIIHSISKESIEKWGEIIWEMNRLLETESPFPFEAYNELDKQFHLTLVEWTENSKVIDIFESLNTHVSLSRVVHATSRKSTIKRHQDHLHLYEAFKQRDQSAFTAIMTKHIESVKEEATS